jgi:hypothetical protein
VKYCDFAEIENSGMAQALGPGCLPFNQINPFNPIMDI